MKIIFVAVLVLNVTASFAGVCKFGKLEGGMWDLHKRNADSLASCLELAAFTTPQIGKDYNYKVKFKDRFLKYSDVMKVSELSCLVMENIDPVNTPDNSCFKD
jgi:hypothetical protein